MGERRCAYWVLVGKPDRRRLLGRPRHRWEDNMKMDLREVGWGGVGGGMDWIDLAEDGQVLGSCECGNQPLDFVECWEFLD
jgi:hypothetical protein